MITKTIQLAHYFNLIQWETPASIQPFFAHPSLSKQHQFHRDKLVTAGLVVILSFHTHHASRSRPSHKCGGSVACCRRPTRPDPRDHDRAGRERERMRKRASYRTREPLADRLHATAARWHESGNGPIFAENVLTAFYMTFGYFHFFRFVSISVPFFCYFIFAVFVV